MWSERPNRKSMLHCLPRFFGETPAVRWVTMEIEWDYCRIEY